MNYRCLFAVLALSLICGCATGSKLRGSTPAEDAKQEQIPAKKSPKLEAERRLLGDGSEKIILVEFTDFQCPACRMGHDNLAELKAKYKSQIQFYIKHMPLDFHPHAYPAALYFEAIRLQDKDKALQFAEYVFMNQKSMNGDAFLKTGAKKVGADMKRLAKDIQSDEIKKIIVADINEFNEFEFTGTPSMILNGVPMVGVQRLSTLEKVIQTTGQ